MLTPASPRIRTGAYVRTCVYPVVAAGNPHLVRLNIRSTYSRCWRRIMHAIFVGSYVRPCMLPTCPCMHAWDPEIKGRSSLFMDDQSASCMRTYPAPVDCVRCCLYRSKTFFRNPRDLPKSCGQDQKRTYETLLHCTVHTVHACTLICWTSTCTYLQRRGRGHCAIRSALCMLPGNLATCGLIGRKS